MTWRFSIDVGGTFTDVVARAPEGAIVTCKLLSTGAIRGCCEVGSSGECIEDHRRVGPASGIWEGYSLQLLDSPSSHKSTDVRFDQRPTEIGGSHETIRPIVKRHDASSGRLYLDHGYGADDLVGCSYELRSHEEAPVVAIRQVMGLRLTDSIGPIDVRLGTTRATNALLERQGARVAFVTTKGFGDVLRIGYQDRPALFELNIRKRDELYEFAIEIDERMDPRGHVLRPPNLNLVRTQLAQARREGIEALAICLLHAHVNPVHEEAIAAIAEEIGFSQVSVSSRLTRLERIVPRGDTTVVDAYLGGVIRGYVESFRRSMPDARIQLMTSAGGLMDALRAGGKDTVLSGPAGGVVGCALVSCAAGFDRAIGFDMGGTSTDVSRIEAPPNSFEYQHETVKAGVRIMTPMLAVETVAAGGGSICSFDGHNLCVGPRSAGAEPGPACYGRGGPLAITDMNLCLGRLAAEHFPFPLDRGAVERKLDALCEEVRAGTGATLTPRELAEGFVRIANDHMAAAIKKISIARGYDVRDYVLCTFGGAGGQHACAIARALGMNRVLCSPYAGVLSALGIGAADVKRIGQQSVAVALDENAPQKMTPIFERLESETRRELVREGHARERIRAHRSAELCYSGQSTTLNVAFGSVPQMVRDFADAHERWYGYTHENRPVEIRAVRVEVVAATEPFEIGGGESRAVATGPNPSSSTVNTRRLGSEVNPPIFTRSDLDFAEYVRGPAVIVEDTSTIFVEPGWEAQIIESGDILLTDRPPADSPKAAGGLGRKDLGACHAERSEASPASSPSDAPEILRYAQNDLTKSVRKATGDVQEAAMESQAEPGTHADPIQIELFRNHFASIAEQMGETLRRTALSTNVKERLDFSCAIFDAEGNLVVNAPHIPVHLGGMSECVRCLMVDVGEFQPGDVYVTNDPYRGGSHLNDVTVITPIHDRVDDKVILFVASRAHHAEIGGTRPGSMPPDSTCLAEEGVVIRAFRLIADGRSRTDELRTLLTTAPFPSRSPEENLADIAAQVAANQTGVRELLAMVDRFGLDVVRAYIHHIQVAAERKMRSAIRRLPQGERRFEDRLDDGTFIRVRLDIHDDSATLDFTGTAAVHPGNFNANRAIVTSAVLYCFRCLIADDIPLNAGVLAPITIILPQCFLNPPRHDDARRCAAVAAGNVETSQRIVDVIFGALGIVAASQGTMNNLLIGNDRFGYYETICGGAGAGPGFHGADAVHTNMTNTRLTDPEVLESRYPLRLHRFQIREGSGGLGQFHGGCGVIRELEFLEPLDVSIISQRRLTVPYGVNGGHPGASGRNTLLRKPCLPPYQGETQGNCLPPYQGGIEGGQLKARPDVAFEVVSLPPTVTFRAQTGDRLLIETPGGGGWGAGSG